MGLSFNPVINMLNYSECLVYSILIFKTIHLEIDEKKKGSTFLHASVVHLQMSTFV